MVIPLPSRASLWSSCVVLPLLALTWMSAVLAMTDRRSILFQILFAVFDSIQGFVIITVHCFLRREVCTVTQNSLSSITSNPFTWVLFGKNVTKISHKYLQWHNHTMLVCQQLWSDANYRHGLSTVLDRVWAGMGETIIQHYCKMPFLQTWRKSVTVSTEKLIIIVSSLECSHTSVYVEEKSPTAIQSKARLPFPACRDEYCRIVCHDVNRKWWVIKSLSWIFTMFLYSTVNIKRLCGII